MKKLFFISTLFIFFPILIVNANPSSKVNPLIEIPSSSLGEIFIIKESISQPPEDLMIHYYSFWVLDTFNQAMGRLDAPKHTDGIYSPNSVKLHYYKIHPRQNKIYNGDTIILEPNGTLSFHTLFKGHINADGKNLQYLDIQSDFQKALTAYVTSFVELNKQLDSLDTETNISDPLIKIPASNSLFDNFYIFRDSIKIHDDSSNEYISFWTLRSLKENQHSFLALNYVCIDLNNKKILKDSHQFLLSSSGSIDVLSDKNIYQNKNSSYGKYVDIHSELDKALYQKIMLYAKLR